MWVLDTFMTVKACGAHISLPVPRHYISVCFCHFSLFFPFIIWLCVPPDDRPRPVCGQPAEEKVQGRPSSSLPIRLSLD